VVDRGSNFSQDLICELLVVVNVDDFSVMPALDVLDR
jgi:hypothetical protein